MRDKRFLQTLIGRYDVAGQTLEISFKGEGTIICAFSGQQAVELEPVRGMRFKSKDSDMFSMTFTKDEAGRVTGFTYVTMGYVIPAKRVD